jgi:methionyl-tRNA formyltransferase
MNNVVFLGIDRPYSINALEEVKKMDCAVTANHLNQNKFKSFPQSYDLGISLGYLYKVPLKELSKSPWINFHPAPLPNYGGRNVAYHAILNKESHFGATIHYMNEEFDGGDIIETRKFEFSLGTTAEELYNLACETSLDLLKEYIPKVLNGERVDSVKQNNSTYYKKEPINDFINIKNETKRMITARYCPPYYPKIKIGGKTFVIKEEK